MTGIIIKNGYIIAEWGEPLRVDMTHSVTKSFLTATVGLAFDRKLIKEFGMQQFIKKWLRSPAYNPLQRFDDAEKFGKRKFLELFETEHNRKITWDDLLRQSSDWEGTLWGKPDWADRPDRDPTTWLTENETNPERFTNTMTSR